MKEFLIILGGSPDEVFHPGSVITGTVLCENSVPKKFKQIVVYLEGRVDVAWAGTRSLGDVDSCVNRHSSSNVYISQNAVLWDKDVHGQGGMFPEGIQNLTFSFQLPRENIPSSFTGQFGTIKYFIAAKVLKIGALKSDSTVTHKLNVASYVSIDYDPQLTMPTQVHVQKSLCCLCCATAPVVMTASIPRRGYLVQDDGIPLEVHVENGSFRNINKIQVYIEKRVIFSTGSGSHRFRSEQICQLASSSIRSHSSFVYKPNLIVVPRDTPPSLLNCDFISINYFLHITAVITLHIDLEIEIPLIFGNICSHPAAAAVRQSSFPPQQGGLLPGQPPPVAIANPMTVQRLSSAVLDDFSEIVPSAPDFYD